MRNAPSLFGPGVVAEDVANFLRGYIPYLHGSRDVSEPETLYLWDAAARAGLTYRNYGEFVATLSESDVAPSNGIAPSPIPIFHRLFRQSRRRRV
jgi:hypothetical protein